LVMFTVKQRGIPYGMAITASHNPAIYNGIKIFTAGGRDADETVTRKIEAEIKKLTPESVKSIPYEKALQAGIVREGYPFNEYIDSILELVDVQKIKESRLRIAIDPMYGVSNNSLRTILLTCRCDVDVIREQHDTLFGGRMPAPSAEAQRLLSVYVTEHGCHLGIATDGDADRLGVIDEKGNYLHANVLLVLLYYYLVKYRGWKGPCVRNVSTTHLLDRVARAFGEECYEVPVGFKHVSGKMLETNAVIGGESSGGMAIRGHIQGKDGIYAAALLVEMLAVTGKTIAQIYREIIDQYGMLYFAEKDLATTPENKQWLQQQIFEQKKLPEFGETVAEIRYEDGCKILFADGSWTVCRFSGTEPLLRLAAEGNSDSQAQSHIHSWEAFLER